MFKQMAWLSLDEVEGPKMLHLRLDPHQPWQPYTAFPDYIVPDYPIKNVSKGFATFQKLIREGWELMPSHISQTLHLFQWSKET